MKNEYISQSDNSETKIKYFTEAIKDEAARGYFTENTRNRGSVKAYAESCDVALTDLESGLILLDLVGVCEMDQGFIFSSKEAQAEQSTWPDEDRCKLYDFTTSDFWFFPIGEGDPQELTDDECERLLATGEL